MARVLNAGAVDVALGVQFVARVLASDEERRSRPAVRWRRAWRAATRSGPERIRTADVTRARGALYQLSYWPVVDSC
jgi:hypothetical protein